MKHPLPLHPFLFGLTPILFAYAHNIRNFPVRFEELLLPMAATLILGGALWALLGLALRNREKAAVITTLFLVLFFLYGHVPGGSAEGNEQPGFLIVIFVAVIALGTLLVVRARGNLAGLTVGLNIAGAAILVMNLGMALPGLARRPDRPAAPRGPVLKAAADAPDIYYIILDTYLRSDYLRADYGEDNSDFLDFLRSRGFYIVERGRSNYRYTLASLASSLNFSYLDSLAQAQGRTSVDATPLIRMIEYSRVAEFLKRRGYRVVTFASGHTGTELRNADQRIAPVWQLSEFQDMLVRSTMLAGLVGILGENYIDRIHARLVRRTLQDIPRAPDGGRPVFAFSHIVCPHWPFVFDADGNFPTNKPRPRTERRERGEAGRLKRRSAYTRKFAEQVHYVNVMTRQTVEHILADTTRPVVIIIQGDHGTIHHPRGKFAILNAIRVPQEAQASSLKLQARRETAGSESTNDQAPMTNGWTPDSAIRIPQSAVLYDSMTPVNTFRVLFNRLFDTSMVLLPDYSYNSTMGLPYDFELDPNPPEAQVLREADGD